MKSRNAMDNATILVGVHGREKAAEGVAIARCALSLKCDTCQYLVECANKECFKFPDDAACTVEKNKILREWEAMDGQVHQN